MKFPASGCFALWMIASASRLCGQTDAAPTPRPSPPSPPFVTETPEFAAWTVAHYTITGLAGQPADAVIRGLEAAPKPEWVTSVTKTGSANPQTGRIRHQLRKLKSGDQENVWYEHGNKITMESIWTMPVFEGGVSNAKSPQGPDFPEFSWLNAENFVGTQAAQSATYLVFESKVTEGDPARAKEYGYQLKATFNRAYINADTRLPWLLQTGDVLQRYFFQSPPTTPLEVPPEYQAMFDSYERRKIESTRKPAAP